MTCTVLDAEYLALKTGKEKLEYLNDWWKIQWDAIGQENRAAYNEKARLISTAGDKENLTDEMLQEALQDCTFKIQNQVRIRCNWFK